MTCFFDGAVGELGYTPPPSVRTGHLPFEGRLNWCGDKIGFRADVVIGPYGVERSALVVVGADDHIRPKRWGTDPSARFALSG